MLKLIPLVEPEPADLFLIKRMINYDNCLGDLKVHVFGTRYIRAIHCAKFSSVTLCYSKTFPDIDIESSVKKIESSPASIIITHNSIISHLKNVQGLVVSVDDPLGTFIELILNSTTNEQMNTCVFPYSTYVEDGALISSTAQLRGHNYICTDTVIGDNVVINPGTVIGMEDLGKIKLYNGKMTTFPHIGGVILQECVQIGANTCINKGTLEDTIIGENSVIGNMCHIAHQVIIGKNSRIGDGCTICGSVVIGDNVYIAPGVVISNGVNIENNAFIGIGSTVIKDIKENQRILSRSVSVRI